MAHAVYECSCGFTAGTATAFYKHLTSTSVKGQSSSTYVSDDHDKVVLISGIAVYTRAQHPVLNAQ